MKWMYSVCFLLFFVAVNGQSKALFDLARNGNNAQLKDSLIANKDLVNTTNASGHTLLILAAYNNQPATVKFLLEFGANPKYSFSQGTALHGAAFKGHAKIVKMLIEVGCPVNETDANGSTPLMYATLFKHEATALLLHQAKADPNLKDNTGSSSLDYAKSLSLTKLVDAFSK